MPSPVEFLDVFASSVKVTRDSGTTDIDLECWATQTSKPALTTQVLSKHTLNIVTNLDVSDASWQELRQVDQSLTSLAVKSKIPQLQPSIALN